MVHRRPSVDLVPRMGGLGRHIFPGPAVSAEHHVQWHDFEWGWVFGTLMSPTFSKLC